MEKQAVSYGWNSSTKYTDVQIYVMKFTAMNESLRHELCFRDKREMYIYMHRDEIMYRFLNSNTQLMLFD
jgi:hypothetical protein